MGAAGPRGDVVLKNLSAIGWAGIEDDGYRAGNPKLRLEDMELDGAWASVIYGPVALGFPIGDPSLQDPCYAAWNDWSVEEFIAAGPDRLCILAFLPSHSPEAVAAELLRCAGRCGGDGGLLRLLGLEVDDTRRWCGCTSGRR